DLAGEASQPLRRAGVGRLVDQVASAAGGLAAYLAAADAALDRRQRPVGGEQRQRLKVRGRVVVLARLLVIHVVVHSVGVLRHDLGEHFDDQTLEVDVDEREDDVLGARCVARGLEALDERPAQTADGQLRACPQSDQDDLVEPVRGQVSVDHLVLLDLGLEPILIDAARNETAGQLVGFGGVARQSLSGEDGKNQVRALLTARERTAELLARTGEDLDSHDLSLLEPAMRPVGVFLWGAAFTAETAARWEWGASEAPGKNLVEPGRLEALDVQGLLQLAGVRIADQRGQGASLAAGTGVLDLDPLAVRGLLDQERGDLVES